MLQFTALLNIFTCISPIPRRNPRSAQNHPHGDQAPIQAAPADDICPAAVSERSYVFQESRGFCRVRHQAEEIHDHGDPQAGARAVFSHEGGEAEADARQFDLHDKVREMDEVELFPRDRLTYTCDGSDGHGIDDQVHGRDLDQDSGQLFCYDPDAADGMRQEELGGPVLLFFAEHADRAQGCKESAAKPEHIAALNGVIAGQGTEIQPVHAEGCGKGAHRGKEPCDLAHFRLHFRIQKNAERKKKSNRNSPYQEGDLSLTELVLCNGHVSSLLSPLSRLFHNSA